MTEPPPPPLSQGLDPALGFKVRPGSGDPEINIRIRGSGGKAEMTGMKNPIGGFPYTDTESHVVSFELLLGQFFFPFSNNFLAQKSFKF